MSFFTNVQRVSCSTGRSEKIVLLEYSLLYHLVNVLDDKLSPSSVGLLQALECSNILSYQAFQADGSSLVSKNDTRVFLPHFSCWTNETFVGMTTVELDEALEKCALGFRANALRSSPDLTQQGMP